MAEPPHAEPAYALITGASSGIGAAFARALARQGRRLVLTGRDTEALRLLEQELAGVVPEVHTVAADLRAEDGVDRIQDYLDDAHLDIDLLINNAGIGSGGAFSQLTLARELEILEVNIRAVVEMAHRQLARMRARGGGAIVNVASIAGFQPVPYMATYAASKAFVLNFSLALWRENRRRGIHVMALCPGTTRTRFFARAGVAPVGPFMERPEAVVAAALRGLRRRRPLVISGRANRVALALARGLPRGALLALVDRLASHDLRG